MGAIITDQLTLFNICIKHHLPVVGGVQIGPGLTCPIYDCAGISPTFHAATWCWPHVLPHSKVGFGLLILIFNPHTAENSITSTAGQLVISSRGGNLLGNKFVLQRCTPLYRWKRDKEVKRGWVFHNLLHNNMATLPTLLWLIACNAFGGLAGWCLENAAHCTSKTPCALC